MADPVAVLCRGCGAANEVGARACRDCGSPLARTAEFPPAAAAAPAWSPSSPNGHSDEPPVAAAEPPVAAAAEDLPLEGYDPSVDAELRDLTDFLSAPLPEEAAAAPVTIRPSAPARRTPPVQWLLGAGALTCLLAAALTVALVRGSGEGKNPVKAPPPPGTGILSLEIPTALPAGSVSATLLKDGATVTHDGAKLENVPPDRIGGRAFPAGRYVLRFHYRKARLADVTAEVKDGEETAVGPSRFQLADIEYEAGLRASREGRAVDNDIDVVHFRRAVGLDPEHVNAHLQLAVYELLNGSIAGVERQLEVVRRLEPKHPDLATIQSLIDKRKQLEKRKGGR